MLRCPAVGTRVLLRYAWRRAPLRNLSGVVAAASRGPGPRNHLIRLDDGRSVVVPAGQVFKLT